MTIAGIERCLAGALAAGFLACGSFEPPPRSFDSVFVSRRDIAASAIADGVVEPILTVEVKSKASGEIVEIPVDTGDGVETGQILVRIDPVDAQNAFDQARADLDAARARRGAAESALRRAEKLREKLLLTEADFELAVLEASQAEAAAVKARVTLDVARRRLEETTVRARMTGTILTRNVEVGNVIASAVSQVSGGKVLMTMADLSTIQVRSLVDEVDIGRIDRGLPVLLSVEAYPGRTFEGEVAKIEPQAVIEQNVTLFPVLVRLSNDDRSLRPGMNAEIEIRIDYRREVLAIPVEAVRAPKEAALALAFLGIDPDRRTARAAEKPRSGGPAPEGRPAVTFVRGEEGPEMRRIRVGLSDWNHTEVLAGLEEGAEVILLPSSTVLRQEREIQERFRRTRSLPGMRSGNRQATGDASKEGTGKRPAGSGDR